MSNFLLLIMLSALTRDATSQGCTNICPPINFGTPVPSLCEGDSAEEKADVTKVYDVCHPSSGSFSFQDFKGSGRVTVISNFYIGCNAGRRESGVFAHIAQKYYNLYGNRTTFISSLKGGSSCSQWADIYQGDAKRLFPDSGVIPREMPLAVSDLSFEIRDDFFTTPFGHPSYVILDGDLKVRHKFIGPCCGFSSYSDCRADTAKSLVDTMSNYLDEILSEETELSTGSGDNSEFVEEVPVNAVCAVGEWTPWSECSVTCGSTSGIRFRYRSVQGENCPEPLQKKSCTTSLPCDDEFDGCVAEIGSSYEIETVSSGFDCPRDIAFHPTPGMHLSHRTEGRDFYPDEGEEAWVLNGYNHSVSIVASLGTARQTTISRRDRGYYHYMINATALAFNTVGNSGRRPDRDGFNYWAVCNDNRNTYMEKKEPNYFMGPTLYNSDPKNLNLVNRLGEVCEEDEECFFLHSDMLHESPACIGIAHDPETVSAYGNVYWAFDSTGNRQEGQLVRFDFSQPHGPGSMDHSVAAIRRFPEITLNRGEDGIHAGMIVHPVTRELFIAEPGANQIIVVNVDSGTFARTAREEYPIYSNALPSFEYSIYECADKRVFAKNIDTPTGLAIGPDGKKLYVAERASGDILVFEIATGSFLTRISTNMAKIGGMAFSPKSKNLFFVDEESNSLYAVKVKEECTKPFQPRVSSSFEEEIAEAKAAIGSSSFSLFRDYTCTADPIVPNATFFDQVHTDTGYASDDPNVQAEMVGMDSNAVFLADRIDCDRTSELNYDALLLGGYYCHTCLPGSQGAECDAGGICSNVQWNGYTCDNEYLLVSDTDGNVDVMHPNKTVVNPSDITLLRGVTYRLTIRGELQACASGGSEDFGCASGGPLLVVVTPETASTIKLMVGDNEVILRVAPKADFLDFVCFSGNSKVQVKERGSVLMRDLKIGDEVLVGKNEYEPVYTFAHKNELVSTKYLQFRPSLLELSHDHMVFVDGKGAVPATMVEIGDFLVNDGIVTSIREVERKGAYSPFTASGTIVVNGVLSSNYISFQESNVLKLGTIQTSLTYQWLAQTFVTPYRIWLTISGQKAFENGSWHTIGLYFYAWYVDQSPMTMMLLLFPISALLVLFVGAEFVSSNPFACMATVASFTLFWRVINKKAREFTL